MSKAKQFTESLDTALLESNSIEFNGKNTKEVVSFLVDNGFKYVVYPNGKLEVYKGNGEYVTLLKDDVISVRNHKLVVKKPSYVSEAVTKATFGNDGEYNYAFKVEGVEPEFYRRPFGRQLDSARAAGKFCKGAKKYSVGCKGKATMACVKEWVKENKPSQFYAKWKKDSSYYKDDSVDIYYVD